MHRTTEVGLGSSSFVPRLRSAGYIGPNVFFTDCENDCNIGKFSAAKFGCCIGWKTKRKKIGSRWDQAFYEFVKTSFQATKKNIWKRPHHYILTCTYLPGHLWKLRQPLRFFRRSQSQRPGCHMQHLHCTLSQASDQENCRKCTVPNVSGARRGQQDYFPSIHLFTFTRICVTFAFLFRGNTPNHHTHPPHACSASFPSRGPALKSHRHAS